MCVPTRLMLLLFPFVFTIAEETAFLHTIMGGNLIHVNSDFCVFAEKKNLTIKLYIVQYPDIFTQNCALTLVCQPLKVTYVQMWINLYEKKIFFNDIEVGLLFLILWENIMVFFKNRILCFYWELFHIFRTNLLFYFYLKTILLFYVYEYFLQTYIITCVHGAHRDQDGCHIPWDWL